MQLNPTLLAEFGLKFNVDYTDFDNEGRMVLDASDIAYAVAERPEARSVISELDHLLRVWAPEDVRQFVRVTNTDWNFDVRTKAALRRILTAIRDELSRLTDAGDRKDPAPRSGLAGL